jgi:hypothetical protein
MRTISSSRPSASCARRSPGCAQAASTSSSACRSPSGIGGGSADAAAALRLLARLNDLPLSHPALLAAAGRIGADVPVCLEARARIMRGIGEQLGPVLRLPRLFALLVNPGVAVETGAGVPRARLTGGAGTCGRRRGAQGGSGFADDPGIPDRCLGRHRQRSRSAGPRRRAGDRRGAVSAVGLARLAGWRACRARARPASPCSTIAAPVPRRGSCWLITGRIGG